MAAKASEPTSTVPLPTNRCALGKLVDLYNALSPQDQEVFAAGLVEHQVRQRVLAEGKEYLARLKVHEEEADRTISTYREFINNHKPLFTIDQFNLMRKCLHQRGIAAEERDFDGAFHLIQVKKFQLTGKR